MLRKSFPDKIPVQKRGEIPRINQTMDEYQTYISRTQKHARAFMKSQIPNRKANSDNQIDRISAILRPIDKILNLYRRFIYKKRRTID